MDISIGCQCLADIDPLTNVVHFQADITIWASLVLGTTNNCLSDKPLKS
jgi:hypothetical protein